MINSLGAVKLVLLKKTRRCEVLLETKACERGKPQVLSRPKVWRPILVKLVATLERGGSMSLVTGIRVKCGNANKYKEFGKSERDREERLGR